MSNPFVSVVIPVFNRKDMAVEAVMSVLSQEPGDLECIVVDDGSEDGTPGAIEGVGDPRVKCIRKGHSGIAATKNAGIREARGRYLAFLDSDDVWMPGKLALQIAELERDGNLALSYGRYRPERGAEILESRPASGPSGMIFRSLLRRIFIQTSTVVMPAAAVAKTGFYDETLAYSDEYDYFLRASRIGPAAFVPRDLVRYRLHAGNESRDRRRRVSENLRVYERFAGDPALCRKDAAVAARRAARYQYLMGGICMEAGEAEEARRHFRLALRWKPFYPGAWAALILPYRLHAALGAAGEAE